MIETRTTVDTGLVPIHSLCWVLRTVFEDILTLNHHPVPPTPHVFMVIYH